MTPSSCELFLVLDQRLFRISEVVLHRRDLNPELGDTRQLILNHLGESGDFLRLRYVSCFKSVSLMCRLRISFQHRYTP